MLANYSVLCSKLPCFLSSSSPPTGEEKSAVGQREMPVLKLPARGGRQAVPCCWLCPYAEVPIEHPAIWL